MSDFADRLAESTEIIIVVYRVEVGRGQET